MAQPPAFEALIAEVDRIVNSPYPTQLKVLRDIVCKQCTHEDISRWVLSRPCQLPKLVRFVLDALRRWPFALELVTRLSHSVVFRDAFLEVEPTLLRDIVVQAAQAEDAGSRYTDAAVAMLSRHLPRDIAIPMECQTLLVRLFDHAAHQPSVASIRPIYQLLRGSSALLLGVLSDSTLMRFEDHLFTIVRNVKGDDQSLSLYCLAIMKTLAQASDECLSGAVVSSFDTQELLASTDVSFTKTWKPDVVQQYFTERKAQKTIQLIVLRVMWACTATTSDSLDDKMESLQLANELIMAVPAYERETWRKANALVPKKLEEKLNSQPLDMPLRFQALFFLLRLNESGNVPATVLDGLRNIILDINQTQYGLFNGQPDVIDYMVRRNVIDTNTTTAFMQNVVDHISSADPETIAEKSTSIISILRHLVAASGWQDSITDGVMLALDVLACGHKLRNLETSMSRSSPDSTRSANGGVCFHTLQGLHRQLIHELCKVFLTASLTSSQSCYSIPQESLSLLLDLHASSAQNTSDCQHVRNLPSAARKQTFVEAQSTLGDAKLDWRESLHLDITTQCTSHCERLESLFVKACSDLEERCNNVEQPLRDEQRKLSTLQAKYDDLHNLYTALETDNLDGNVQFEALETERDQAMTELQAAQNDNEVLSLTIVELQQRVRGLASRVEQSDEEGRCALEREEFAHAAVLANKVEEFEDLQEALRAVKKELEAKESAFTRIQAELVDATANLQAARGSVQQLEQWKIEHESALQTLTAEKEAAVSSADQVKARVTTLSEQLVEMEAMHKTNVRRIEDEAMEGLASQKAEHETQISNLSNEHATGVEKLRSKLVEVENSAVQAREDHLSELQTRDAELSESYKKLDRLRQRYEDKAQQLATATAMQKNIAAAMGLRTVQQAPLPRCSSRTTSSAQTPHRYDEDEIQDPSPPTPFSGDDVDTQPQNATITSFSDVELLQGGPMPKRPRSRKAFKIPSPAKPQMRLSTTSRSTGKGRPLVNVGVNCQSPVSMKGGKTPAKNGMEFLDETTWDGSEIFSGTQI